MPRMPKRVLTCPFSLFSLSDRVEKQLKELQEKTEKKRLELVQTQTMLQQAAGQK